jgi:hypothetical protein
VTNMSVAASVRKEKKFYKIETRTDNWDNSSHFDDRNFCCMPKTVIYLLFLLSENEICFCLVMNDSLSFFSWS